MSKLIPWVHWPFYFIGLRYGYPWIGLGIGAVVGAIMLRLEIGRWRFWK